MIQEEKQLLLKDLCARLPYGVKCQTKNGIGTLISVEYSFGENLVYVDFGSSEAEEYDLNDGDVVKPYLRPISSMTEEEKEELKSKCIHTETEEDWEGVRSDMWGIQILGKYDTRRWDNTIWTSTINMDAIDWLNANHFDYSGLIERGLAIEATKDMYKTE